MKKYILILLFFGMLSNLVFSDSDTKVVKISIQSTKNKNVIQNDKFLSTKKKLKKLLIENELLDSRVKQLELAVIQLQNKIFNLNLDQNNKTDKTKYTYYIKTPLNGTFYGTGLSKAEAKAKALQKCEASASSIFCDENKLKTDH